MRRCYGVNFEMRGGSYLKMVFEAMKKVQAETDLVDDSATISYDEKTKLTAGFYDNYDDFDDIFYAVLTSDKELIKRHVEKCFPTCDDPDVKEDALKNIYNAMKSLGNEFTNEEYEELKKLSSVKTR